MSPVTKFQFVWHVHCPVVDDRRKALWRTADTLPDMCLVTRSTASPPSSAELERWRHTDPEDHQTATVQRSSGSELTVLAPPRLAQLQDSTGLSCGVATSPSPLDLSNGGSSARKSPDSSCLTFQLSFAHGLAIHETQRLAALQDSPFCSRGTPGGRPMCVLLRHQSLQRLRPPATSFYNVRFSIWWRLCLTSNDRLPCTVRSVTC